MRKLLSFTIPCYRSEQTIEQVVGELVEIVSSRPEFDYEIICVNDCSPDNVLSVLRRLADENPKIKVISLACNKGKHAALLTSYHYVCGQYIIAVDDDGETPIAELWQLIDALEAGYDVAVARYTERAVPYTKKLASWLNDITVKKLLNKPDGIKFSNFVARRRFVCDYLRDYPGPYPSLEGATLAITHNIAMVDMPARARLEGSSGFTFTRGLRLWLNGCTTYSVVPLHLPMYCGFACVLIALIGAIVALLVGASVGLAIVLLLFGFVFFCLGLLGEYVGRIYMVVNHVPQQVIRETINCTDIPE